MSDAANRIRAGLEDEVGRANRDAWEALDELLAENQRLQREVDKFKRAHEVAAGFANDKLIPRAVAAEARCARLEAALRKIAAEGYSYDGNGPQIARETLDAL